MKIIIVTGMSGAGKSTALNVLEDEGYYCVDNMPISLIPKFAELADGHKQDKGYNNIALGIDIRSGHSLAELDSVLDYMKEKKYDYTIMFLESSDEVLIKRYKETRRAHPLAKDGRVDKAIMLEREQLKFLKQRADVIIDTSQLLTREFKEELEKIVLGRKEFNNLMVTVLSFGFKYGIPSDADIVFDVRFLPNPYYVEELRPLTGNDKKIQDYVMKAPEAEEFLERVDGLIQFLLPNYVKEGKYRLVIAIGCTGGKHRSVTLANELYKRMKDAGNYGIKLYHRDVDSRTI